MSNYTGGLKIKDKEVRRIVNNAIERTIDKACTAGMETNKRIRRYATIEWFREEGHIFASSYHTLLDSLCFEKPIITQKQNIVVIDFISYYDSAKYEIEHTSLYKSIHRKSGNRYPEITDPTRYIVENLQWEQGIIGLPKESCGNYGTHWENKHYFEKESLRDFTKYQYTWDWRRFLNQTWKKMGNAYIKKF